MHTPIIVTWGRSPVIILVPVIISVSLSLAVMVAVMISMIASPPAASPASIPTQSEARPGRLAVMEVDSRRRLVGRVGDTEVHPDFKARYLGPIHRLSRLLRVLDSLEVDESESPRSLGRAIQHHRHLVQLAESAKFSL